MIFSRQDASILGLPISESVPNGNTVLLAATEAVQHDPVGRRISGSGLGTTFILTLPRQIGPEKEREPIFEELVVSYKSEVSKMWKRECPIQVIVYLGRCAEEMSTAGIVVYPEIGKTVSH